MKADSPSISSMLRFGARAASLPGLACGCLGWVWQFAKGHLLRWQLVFFFHISRDERTSVCRRYLDPAELVHSFARADLWRWLGACGGVGLVNHKSGRHGLCAIGAGRRKPLGHDETHLGQVTKGQTTQIFADAVPGPVQRVAQKSETSEEHCASC